MATLSTGKIAEVIFENMLETYEHNTDLLKRTSFFMPQGSVMQNTNNEIWRPVQQHAPIIEGWDLSSMKQGIVEQVYPNTLGTPLNDIVELRADDMRDMRFWERRGRESGMKQASELNRRIAQTIATEGAVYYNMNTTTAFDFIAEADTLLFERDIDNSGMRTFVLNDRDALTFASQLAQRQEISGRVEEAWRMNSVGNVSNFDVFTASFLPMVNSGTQSTTFNLTSSPNLKPIGANANGTNADYREGVLDVATNSVMRGDKLTIANVNAASLTNKIDTDQLMTFTVTATDNAANTITVRPRPMLVNQSGSTLTEQAYGNCVVRGQTSIPVGANAAISVQNRFSANQRANLFFDREAVEVMGGTVPADLFRQFNGYKVITERMENGQEVYMLFSGDIERMTFNFRIFTWYGITVREPLSAGVAVRAARV